MSLSYSVILCGYIWQVINVYVCKKDMPNHLHICWLDMGEFIVLTIFYIIQKSFHVLLRNIYFVENTTSHIMINRRRWLWLIVFNVTTQESTQDFEYALDN